VAGLLLIGSAVATALLLAAAARLPGLAATLLAAYLAFVANLGLVTLVLSPARQVTRGGLAVAEGVLLAAALAVWWLRGQPGLQQLAGARGAAREILTDPLTAAFLVVVLVLLAYEGVLASVPPNNMDSLTYHLTRAAAWAQYHGIHWIPNAPEVELTAYQPFAEQQILFLFVATGKGSLYALPQYVAQLAILVAAYGGARRLGFAVRPAACAAGLLATFSVVALEAFTAQNDLVTASFAAVATYFLLGTGRLEPALAGASAALGIGTKLTYALVVPLLACLALVRGRRALVWSVIGGIAGLVAIGMWGYVMNVDNTGRLLGTDTAGVQDRAPPGYPRSVANVFYLLYGLMDASVLSSRLIHVLAIVGAVLGVAVAAWWLRRGTLLRAIGEGLGVAAPFVAAVLVIGLAGVFSWIAGKWGFPIRGSGGIIPPLEENLNEEYTRIANEDYSAFGPVGIIALAVASGLAIRAVARRRADASHLVIASALPVFLVLISLESRWVPFLIRFFLLPVAIAGPLLAYLFRNRLATAAYLVMGTLAIAITIVHDQPKPLHGAYGRPWNLDQLTALRTNSDGYVADALDAYNQLVPRDACVGAVIGINEPTYVLYGPNREHHLVFLRPDDILTPAYREGLFHVVYSPSSFPTVEDTLRNAGWRIDDLGTLWKLATDEKGAAASTSCS
jgi:hypothetical protein